MNLTPVILGGLAGAIAPLAIFAYARKKKLQILKGHKWEVNLSDIKCPKCGSTDTKLDLKAAENLKFVPLTAVTNALTLPGPGTPVRMRCCICKSGFLG